MRSVVAATQAERLRLLARDQQMPLLIVLEAAFSIVTSRWTGSREIVMGTQIGREGNPGADSPLDGFGDMIQWRILVDPWGTIDEALGTIRASLEKPVRDTTPPEIGERYPPYVFLFVTGQSPERIDGAGVAVANVLLPPVTSRRALALTVLDAGADRGLDIELQYDSDLFDESSMARFLAQWQHLLRSMADDTTQRLCDLDLMSTEDRLKLLAAGDRTAERAPFVPVAELVAESIEQHPDHVAIEYGYQRVTYRDLGRQARHLAGQLETYGLHPGDVVAVAVERSAELVVAQLAVVFFGGVLLPIDVDQPARRIDAMLCDANARLVLASDAGAIGLSSLLPVLDVVTSLANVTDASAASTRTLDAVRPESGSYALFTSGSTGRPKGVVNTHVGIANRIAWMQDTYRLTSTDRVLYKTPVSFDVAMWEWLWPLTAGAVVVVASPGAHRDPAALARAITEHRVTITHFIPSMLRLFATQPEALYCKSLRHIVCSGEELTSTVVEEALRICPAIDNLYGPTEAAIDVTRWACNGTESKVPIGGPISGVCARVVDETGALVPLGVPGELLVGGVALARGYASRPDLTGRAFVPDPWGDGERLYRTGDRVRWREPGVLEFIGRLDSQVKIRGVRVEPGEVESILAAHPGVVESAVVVRTDERRGPHLVAFVSGSPPVAALRNHLRGALPEPMLPTAIQKVAAMPRTASGKIDRVDLASRALTPTS